MQKIGYRTYIRPEWGIAFIQKYTQFFQVMEVKTNKKFIEDVYIQTLIRFCEKCGVSTLSFQLPTRTLVDESECSSACDLMEGIENGNGMKMLMQFWGNTTKSEMHAYAIQRIAKEKNLTTVLENVAVNRNLTKYLEALKEFAIKGDFKVCLDLAVLFYSIKASRTTFDAVMGYFKKDPWWRENIVEVHMHDYSKEGCHLNMGDGIMYNASWNIREIFDYLAQDCVIIFETKIQDLECQAVAEVENFKEHLKK